MKFIYQLFQKNNQRGFAAFYITILVLAMVFVMAVNVFILAFDQQKISINIVRSSQAYYIAESGIEDAVYRIKNMLSPPSDYSIDIGSGSSEVLINSPNQNTKIITSSANNKNIFRKIETTLIISTVNPQFFYGAQADTLGIAMKNNSRIEGAGGAAGNVYSNGSIVGANGATITGDVFVATGMSEDQKHTVYNSDQIFGQAIPIIDIAQSFKPDVSDKLVKLSIYIKKVGKPGDQTVRILTDSSGSPSKTLISSTTLQGSLVGTSYGWVDIVFPSQPVLTKSTNYWFMIDASNDSKNYWSIGKDQNQGYGNGQAKYSEDWNAAVPSWIDIAGDLNFKIFMGGQATFMQDVNVLGNAYVNTIKSSKICGDSYYQTIDFSSFSFLNDPKNPPCSDPFTPGTANSGSPDPSLENLPISDSNINQWKQDAADGGIYSGDLEVDSDISLGPKKIDGNLLIDGKITLALTGTIYVTGYINISNGAAIRCSPGYGLYSCVILADKWIHIENNGIFSGSGQEGSFVMILTNSNCDGSSPADCTDNNAAMDLHNNATGVIFYANNGLIYVHNNVEASGITAKKIYLDESSTIRYEQGLINASFSSGPGGAWKISSWKEIE